MFPYTVDNLNDVSTYVETVVLMSIEKVSDCPIEIEEQSILIDGDSEEVIKGLLQYIN